MTMLLLLPVDILLDILERLDSEALVSCRATCVNLKTTIDHSVSLQYKIELAACGMLDGPRDDRQSLDVTERLRRLQLYDDAWRTPRWAQQADFTHLHGLVPPESFFVSLSNEDLVFIRESHSFPPSSTTMVLQRLPSALRGVEERHREVVVPGRLNDVVIDSSQDLLIWGEIMINSQRRHVHHLRELSTGDSHPMAFNRSTESLESDTNFFNEMANDICGDYLLLEWLLSHLNIWKYMVCNWKTGAIVYTGEQPFALVSERRRFLDLYNLVMDVNRPSSGESHGPIGIKVVRFRDDPSTSSVHNDGPNTTPRSHIFLLPVAMQHPGTRVTFEISPWRMDTARTPGYFHSDPADRLLAIDVTAPSSRETFMSIHVPARTLLSYVDTHSGTTEVPWEMWGPQGARATLRGYPIDGFTVQGMRTVVVSYGASDPLPRMTVLDYYPRRVGRALARQRAGDSAVTILHGGEIYAPDDVLCVKTARPCLSVEVPLPDDLARSFREQDGAPMVFLCEDGLLVVELDPTSESEVVKRVWTFTV
ncbi:hypothetical protein BV25DRAFT_1901474 [Artomyces pyxidatus]|uniref:Uncharacterized protein n=2 Tax=Artomyces pyxidatus TaxID=48021 RepID=A0ACB8STK0_9AGAM|nr:hypothetical protein BV25DRAFT_1996096 [Artomyces pyxidatus]KAI0059765.1 hypothetical protein BV25DRAFT_1901474 [Artomyces pyxidatus]